MHSSCYTQCVRVIPQFGLCAFLIFSLSSAFSWSQSAAGSRNPAGKNTATPILRRFEERYRDASSLAATFLERYQENGRVVRVEAGEAYFLRPGKMRWDYEAPEKNTFLVDGKYVWFYSPSDHTATRMSAKKSQDWRTPFAFLTSQIKLSRLCSQLEPARDLEPSQADGLVYRCTLSESQNPDSP